MPTVRCALLRRPLRQTTWHSVLEMFRQPPWSFVAAADATARNAPCADFLAAVSEWNDKNRAKARDLADSHGNRVPAGGWPKMKGTEEAKQKQSVREIDTVLRPPEIQVKLAIDARFGPVIRYRGPEKHQEGVPGVVNTGRGAVYDKNGLVHLLSNDRPPDTLEAQQAKYDLQDAKRKAKKEAKNAGV